MTNEEIARRDLFRMAGAAAFAFSGVGRLARQGSPAEFVQIVPADKKLPADWVKSLTARGQRTVYRGNDLRLIGMPVGGICAGQVFLGGDGRIWLWDIFNQIKFGVVDKTVVFRGSQLNAGGGANYVAPPEQVHPFQQEFILTIGDGAERHERPLDHRGWRDISFTGEYPIGYVHYADPEESVSVTLEAFSPFIPLNTDDSELPATILRYTIKNDGLDPVAVQLKGEMENPVGLHTIKSTEASKFTAAYDAAHHVGVDFSVRSTGQAQLDDRPDFGTMTLALLDRASDDAASAEGLTHPAMPDTTRVQSLGEADDRFRLRTLAPAFDQRACSRASRTQSLQERTDAGGRVQRRLDLGPGESATATFVVAWHFPNLTLPKLGAVDHHYAQRFATSRAVVDYIAANHDRLYRETKLWHDTWYDSTLPYWFLDRTMGNTATLATMTSCRFANGRFYGWEGIGCCEGTCGHVWLYAQAVARLFPELERSVREMVDFGTAFHADTGLIEFRGEYGNGYATDAQAGYVLRTYREHQMSADGAFLSRVYPRAKKALEYLIAQDPKEEGVISNGQHNTLDVNLYGPSSWLTSLYLAALRAGEELATETEDSAFAQRCRTIFESGTAKFVPTFWNGEYFVHHPDPSHPEALRYGDGCEIDQLMGQGYAWQLGLGRIVDADHTRQALAALYRNNFLPDVGRYRDRFTPGRWYAMPGEGGLLMCTFPKGDREQILGNQPTWASMYFNECMTGFEYEAASHMVAEGMVEEGMAVTRMVHDRYHASKRNPWNEVECSDHYARCMAVYGVFVAACGFEHHGPKGHIGFAPRISPSDFRAPFTVAEGWGTFSQHVAGSTLNAKIEVKHGRLRLRTIALALPAGIPGRVARVHQGKTPLLADLSVTNGRSLITLREDAILEAGHHLDIRIT